MGLSYVRELDEYPTGARRMKILTMAVLAVLIGSYEAQIAPVVPLLLKDLDMSLATYGAVSGAAAVAGPSRRRSAAGSPTGSAGCACWSR